MSADTAFANAMKYENRWNPYPYFDELRMENPVTRLSNGLFVVTGYEELQALTHDPHLSSDMRNSPLAPTTPGEAKPSSAGDVYGTDPSIIATDPPDHDRMRRQAMQHFGPPHSPNVIPEMESVCETILNGLLDKVKGKTRFDVVDDYAYPLPVSVIFKIMGVPMEMPRSGCSTRQQVDQTVVSVGPYMFHSVQPRSSSCCARSADSGSPPHKAWKPCDGCRGNGLDLRVGCFFLAQDADRDSRSSRCNNDRSPHR